MSPSDCDKTQITSSFRVNWFWCGYAHPSGVRTMAYAKGSAVSMLGAANFVMHFCHRLRSLDVPLKELGGEVFIDECGTWNNCETAAHLLERAARELSEELPHIVPLRTGHGILYASGPSPDVWQWEEIKRLAGLPCDRVAGIREYEE